MKFRKTDQRYALGLHYDWVTTFNVGHWLGEDLARFSTCRDYLENTYGPQDVWYFHTDTGMKWSSDRLNRINNTLGYDPDREDPTIQTVIAHWANMKCKTVPEYLADLRGTRRHLRNAHWAVHERGSKVNLYVRNKKLETLLSML